MITLLILATQPWSTLAIPALFICASATATASPLVVIRTTSSSTSMPDSNLLGKEEADQSREKNEINNRLKP
jgi:hypothetical protein